MVVSLNTAEAIHRRRLLVLRRWIQPGAAIATGLMFGSVHLSSAAEQSATGDAQGFVSTAHVLRDGATLAYVHRPTPPGTATLVLIPETHGDRQQFLGPLVDQLPATLGVVIVESRGQGSSWPPPDESKASIEEYATDVLEVVGRLQLRSWYVGGHSLGGMQAIEIAGRRPAELKGVISLEGWTHHEVQAEAFGGLPPRTEEQRAADRVYREERYARLRWTPEEYQRLVSMWRRWTRGEAILRDLPHPILSVWGDRGMPARPTREVLRLPAAPSCELVWIEGADHYITRPPHAAVTGAAIARFIARVEAGIGSPPSS